MTEAAYQKLAYYVAAGYTVAQMIGYMDVLASWLFSEDINADGTKNYHDLLAWRPDASAADVLRRPIVLNALADLIAAGRSTLEMQKSISQLMTPQIGAIDGDQFINAQAVTVEAGFLYVADGYEYGGE